jgi:hypothetical protein
MFTYLWYNSVGTPRILPLNITYDTDTAHLIYCQGGKERDYGKYAVIGMIFHNEMLLLFVVAGTIR